MSFLYHQISVSGGEHVQENIDWNDENDDHIERSNTLPVPRRHPGRTERERKSNVYRF